jgi:hypothetical protein
MSSTQPVAWEGGAHGRVQRRADGVAPRVIELRIDRIGQLFHTLDPFPFPDRDLDPHAEEFIVDWARELPNRRICILVHLPKSEAEKEEAQTIAPAIGRYFDYRAGATSRDLRELFRHGRMALAVGLTALAVCMTLSQLAVAQLGETGVGLFLEESLIILGWVANWRPLEIFLYEWWPIIRKRSLYRRLAQADIQLHPD